MDWSEIMSESMVQSQNLHVDHHCHLQKLEFSGYICALVCLGESTGKTIGFNGFVGGKP